MDKDLIEQEDKEMIVTSKPLEETIKVEKKAKDPFTDAIKEAVKEAMAEVVQDNKIGKTEIVGQPWVKTEFPDVQKVRGIVEILKEVTTRVTNLPPVQKITGTVSALVKFPDIQKITGTVTALVKFPDVQKVDIEFPDTQKVVGKVDITNLPIAEGAEASMAKANPTRYVPVRLSNGKRFYDLFENLAKAGLRRLTAATDSVSAKLASDAIMIDNTPLIPLFSPISATNSGDNTVVAAQAGKKIRVLLYTAIASVAVDATWKSGASTNKTGAMSFATNGGASPAMASIGQFETNAGEALVLNLSGSATVAGHLTYILI